MRPTEKLHEQGQSLWLDNITRKLLTSNTLRRYIDEFSITFDSPSVFAAILDDKKGGRFQLTSTHEDTHTIHTRTYSTTRYWDNLFNTHYKSDCYSS